MKSNKVMKRQMGEYDVFQRTSDSYFNASSILSQWNSKGNSEKKINKYLSMQKTKDFIFEIESNLQMANLPNADYRAVKKIVGRSTHNGRTADEIWLHPFVFLDMCMWLEPKFKVQVIKFVYDELISLRCNAGDNYIQLMKRVYGFKDCDFGRVAIAMNFIVFNEHSKQRRDCGTVAQTQELKQLEATLCSMIDTGLVTNQMELIQVLRKMYEVKYRKF